MITVTEKAAEKIAKNLVRRGKGIGLRVAVKTTGCSGLAYVLEYVDNVSSDDIEYTSNNTKLYVDPKSLAYVTGLQIDWIRNGLNEGFDFKNPNERDRCGCGESFRI